MKIICQIVKYIDSNIETHPANSVPAKRNPPLKQAVVQDSVVTGPLVFVLVGKERGAPLTASLHTMTRSIIQIKTENREFGGRESEGEMPNNSERHQQHG